MTWKLLGAGLALSLTVVGALALTSLGQFVPLGGSSGYVLAGSVAALLCVALPLWLDLRLTRFARRENPGARRLPFSALGAVNVLWLVVLGVVFRGEWRQLLEPVGERWTALGGPARWFGDAASDSEVSSDARATPPTVDAGARSPRVAGEPPSSGDADGSRPPAVNPHAGKPRSTRLYASFDQVSRHLHVADLEHADPIRYGSTDCALQYQLRAQVGFEHMDPDAPPGGRAIQISGKYTVDASRARWVFDPVEISLNLTAQEVALPSTTMATASVHLELGEAPREVDGRTATWSALGSFPGLVFFYPPLSAEPDSTWSISWFPQGSGYAELMRGPLAPADPEEVRARVEEAKSLTPTTILARVERRGWVSVDGIPAALLHASATVTESGTLDSDQRVRAVEMQSSGQLEADYVVLHGGRILHAEVRYVQDAAMGRDVGPFLKVRSTLQANQWLTHHCGGPALAPPAAPRGGREVALESYAALRESLETDDGDASRFSERLSTRHPGRPLKEVLRATIEARGPRIFGVPELADEIVSPTAGEVEFMLMGSDSTKLTQHVRVRMIAEGEEWKLDRLCVGPIRERVQLWRDCSVFELRS
jgi:hypothetical protein